MPETLEFHIKLHKKNTYRLEVFERGSSQPLAQSSFDYDRSYLTQFEINSLDTDPKDPQGRMDRLKEFGKKLYGRIFTPEIQKLWSEHSQEKGFLTLCIRLAVEAKDLEALPWETLHDGSEFIAAGARTSLSRLPLDVELQQDLEPVAPPLNMLAVLSSPLDLKDNERLQIEREQEILLQAVNTPSGQGKLLLEFEDEAKLDFIESSLEGGCQILHYSGHGISPEAGGGLLLEDAQGNKRLTAVSELLQVLKIAERDLRLAVISGCQTAKTLNIAGFRDLARGLLDQGVPAVIAMQFSILDDAGLILAENLYPRLIEGQSLDVALAASRRALLHNEDVRIQADALAPVLFASNSTPLQTKSAESAKAAVQPKIDFSFHLPLPQLSFGFYGRRREYRAIRDGLLHKNHRTVIIHGIGGIGKTALVSHTARRLKRNFNGIYAFDCTSATLAPETILLELHRYLERQGIATLGQLLHQSLSSEQLAGFLSQVLSQLSLLLIFDNFETHLTHEGTSHKIANDDLSIFLKTLIKTTATGTRFLFTTRYLFDIDARRIGDIHELPLGDLSRPEALGLMQKLPHLSAASFDDKLHAFDTFGGHPFALVTLDRHCANKRLAGVLVDAKAVHTALREFIAIELNYSKLTDRARELLNRLAAFRKPVSFSAAQWVMGEKLPEEITAREFFKKLKDNLEDNVAKLSEDEFVKKFKTALPEQRKADNIDKTVYELIAWGLLSPIIEDSEVKALAVHSLVRDFCREKLKTKEWKKHLCDSAVYYTNQTKMEGRDEKSTTAVWLEMEAFELLFEAEDFEDAASLLIEVTPLLNRWGLGRYCESLCTKIMPKVQKNTQSLLVHDIGILLEHRGDYAAALAQYEKSLKMFEERGERAGMARSLHQIGMIHHDRGDYAAALTHYEKSLKILEELGARAGMARPLHQIGMIHHDRGDYVAALTHYEKSLKILEEHGDRAGMARPLHQIGIIHHDRGDYAAALAQYEKSLKILEELGDRAGVAGSFHQIGMIHQDRGDYTAALAQYEKSLKIFEKLGDRSGVSRSLHQIGIIHQYSSDYTAALAHYKKSLKIKEEIGDRAGVANSHGQMGKLFTKTKEYRKAIESLFFALDICIEIKSPNIALAIRDFRQLRTAWGYGNFDRAWKEKTGEDVPDIIKEDPEKTTTTKKKEKSTKTAKVKIKNQTDTTTKKKKKPKKTTKTNINKKTVKTVKKAKKPKRTTKTKKKKENK
ncbi:MAG: tetratricopeptide repeat protein [Planctomycetes bacterium]|nr:tetratricopeptide repeat protein [Planctomycetota bacterium]